MLSHIYFYDNTDRCRDPYRNIAIEEWLTRHVPEDAVTLFLWQNEKTVVIGRNQNAWRECNIARLEADGGRLARRLSGGGAVYHHIGNLNFTFCAPRAFYDVARQVSVIAKAAAKFGISVQKTGRNDIMADGRKFSGNAFYKTATRAYHHGTILIAEDMGSLVKYLDTAGSKLTAKSVASVPARVVNLAELSSDITVVSFACAMREAFSEIYGLPAEIISDDAIDWETVETRRAFFDSFDWKYGVKQSFTDEHEGKFPWGFLRIYISAENGIIRKATVDSDALAANLIASIPRALEGTPYLPADIKKSLRNLPCEDEEERGIAEDVVGMFGEE